MKYLNAFFLFIGTAIPSFSQSWCDSTLTVCDSISIDSIFFTHTFGDRVHISMTSHHVHLYAPSFVLCPADEDLELEIDHYGYFSLFGPSGIMPFYDILNFEVLGDSLTGRILLDNSNNGNDGCELAFLIPLPQVTGTTEEHPLEVSIFPNPTHDFLHFSIRGYYQMVRQVHMVNSLGEKQEVNYNLDRIDLSYHPAGLYLVLFELKDGSRIARKVIISK